MKTRSVPLPVWGICLGLSVITLLLLGTLIVAADGSPVIYWHTADNGLPSDVQALDVVSYPGITITLYAGTWSSGVYCSADHGVTWLTATAGLSLPMYIKDGLVVNPVTPTMLFAGDYYGGLSGVGVYRSIDGGDSWTVSLADADIETLLVHPLTPTLVFAGDREDGLYRSGDGGDSWQSASLAAARVQTLAAAPSPPGTLYAGADSNLYVSSNGGISWTLASTLSSTVSSLAVHPTTPTLLYAGTRRDGVWCSDDGGATWITQTDGLPSNAWVTSIAIDPVASTTLYAGVWSGQVYRSQDGGVTWKGLGYLGTVQDVIIHPDATSPDGTSGVIYVATSSNGVFRGSTLDHLTMEPVDSPQYVRHAFPITVTARDALGFPLTGASQAQLRALAGDDAAALAETLAAGGFDGTATLTDTTATITPSSITFADGVAVADVMIAAPVSSGTITAAIPSGPGGTTVLPGDPVVSSNPFDVIGCNLYLALVLRGR